MTPETRARQQIDLKLEQAGWIIQDMKQLNLGAAVGFAVREYPTDTGPADYLLFVNRNAVGVIEAKKDSAGENITTIESQTERYANANLKWRKDNTPLRFLFEATGQIVRFTDNADPAPRSRETFHFFKPETLAAWLAQTETLRCRLAVHMPVLPEKNLRNCQINAVTGLEKSLAYNKPRALIHMASGAGKTFTAITSVYRLLKFGGAKRILFLVDTRNLGKQAHQEFMAYTPPDDGRKFTELYNVQRLASPNIDPHAQVCISTIQRMYSILSGEPIDESAEDVSLNEVQQTTRQEKLVRYNPAVPVETFDFIIIDECHRGGANDESTWRAILEYFSPAVQLGLTATPKRDVNVDTYRYFGEPVYIYSLKEGINDGFLTPFKLRQYTTTLDEYMYTSDDRVVEGEAEAGKRYTEADFNRIIEIKQRETYRVKLFMDEIDQRQKTLVFCATQEHALAVRDLINQCKTSTDPNYCHRVTADDGEVGEQHLRDFQDNERNSPIILTTSQKLSTGVDARNVRNIVLMRPVNSMIEFKQIVGRGTRLYEGKDYFTIYDFTKAHAHFADPEWDGEPLEPELRGTGRPEVHYPEPGPDEAFADPPGEEPKRMTRVTLADGKERLIRHTAQTSFWGADGRPVSASEFIRQLFGELPQFFRDEEELRRLWSAPDTRKKLLDGLAEKGFPPSQLVELQRIIDAEKSDLFDVLAYIAYDKGMKDRKERADAARALLTSYNDKQRAFLDFVLDQYVQDGVQELNEEKLPPLLVLKYRSIPDAVKEMGDIATIRESFTGFQRWLYMRA